MGCLRFPAALTCDVTKRFAVTSDGVGVSEEDGLGVPEEDSVGVPEEAGAGMKNRKGP